MCRARCRNRTRSRQARNVHINFGTFARLCNFPSFTDTDKIVAFGVSLDSSFTTNNQSLNVCRSSHFHLHPNVRRTLTELMTLHLFYCCALTTHLSHSSFHVYQYIDLTGLKRLRMILPGSSRPPNLTSTSCDLDLRPPDSQSWSSYLTRWPLVPICSKTGSSAFVALSCARAHRKYRRHVRLPVRYTLVVVFKTNDRTITNFLPLFGAGNLVFRHQF